MARILQLTGDWKWTGPAEPMLGLARALRARGHEVWLSCPGPPPGADRSLLDEARAAGLDPAPVLTRGRGVRWLRDRPDVLRLRAFLAEHSVELVHTWHTRDHGLALRAGRARRRAGLTRVVRSYRKAEAIPGRPWNRWLFGPGADGLVCVSPGTARRNQALRGGRALLGVFGAVDLARFRPAPPDPSVRAGLGLAPGDRVVGIVARVQQQRRFDLLLEAAARLFREDPRARLLVVGRGTHRAEVAERPARRKGIAERVVFAGYRRADYLDVLRSIDVFTYLVPGSDGTCRALLEAAACGLPAVVTRRGALAEIVEDGRSGLVVEEDAGALAAGWRDLLADPERRAALGRAARERAEACFDPERQAAALEAFYAQVLARDPG